MLLPSLRLNEGSKKSFSLESLAGQGSTHIDMADIDMDSQVLTTILTNIRNVLNGKKLLTSYNSRMLPVTIVDVPKSYVASLLSLNKDHAAKLMFQAKADNSYLDHGMKIQHFSKTKSRVP